MSANQSHPHFDDRGNLNWFTSWSAAAEAASASDKKIFLEIGREL